LDTSVPNAYFDNRNPVRQEVTRRFWEKLEEYEVFVSDLVIEEIMATRNVKLRKRILDLIENLEVLSAKSDEVRALAEEYVTQGIIPARYIDDAIHISLTAVN